MTEAKGLKAIEDQTLLSSKSQLILICKKLCPLNLIFKQYCTCQVWKIKWFKKSEGKCKVSAKLSESTLVYQWALMLQNKKSWTKEPPGISSKYQLLTCWKTSNSLHRCSREGWEQYCSRIREQVVYQPLTHPEALRATWTCVHKLKYTVHLLYWPKQGSMNSISKFPLEL